MPWTDNPERYMRRLWRDSHVGCVIITTAGQIIDCNQHFATVLQYTTTELANKHVDELTEYQFRGTGMPELEKVITGQIPYYEQRKAYLRRDGKPTWAKVRSFPIIENRKLLHWFSLVVFEVDVLEPGQELESITQELEKHSRLIEAIVGRRESKTTHIHGSGNATDGGSINDTKIILFVGVAICMVAISIAVLAMGGAFRATHDSEGQQTIEVQSGSD